MNTDEIPSIQRISLTQAAVYISARMIDTVVREYDAGNDNARVSFDMGRNHVLHRR
jgi:hypothetical protein